MTITQSSASRAGIEHPAIVLALRPNKAAMSLWYHGGSDSA